MQGHEAVIDAARIVRHYLHDLVGDRSDEFDNRIAHYLRAHAEGVDVAGPLQQLFESDEVMREWLAELLDDPERLPPEHQAVRSSEFSPIPGSGSVIRPPKWVCPVDQDYVVFQQRSTDPVDEVCPDHQVALVLAV